MLTPTIEGTHRLKNSPKINSKPSPPMQTYNPHNCKLYKKKKANPKLRINSSKTMASRYEIIEKTTYQNIKI